LTRGEADKTKQPASIEAGCLKKDRGGDLLSHKVALAVSSALRGLTAVFGMGTGISLAPKPPQKLLGFARLAPRATALVSQQLHPENCMNVRQQSPFEIAYKTKVIKSSTD